MARLTCAKCGHEWVRNQKPSRGQIIRCPSCRITLGVMSKPLKEGSREDYIIKRAIDEYGMEENKK